MRLALRYDAPRELVIPRHGGGWAPRAGEARGGMVLCGLVVPTIGRTIAVRRLNGRIAKLERAAADQ